MDGDPSGEFFFLLAFAFSAFGATSFFTAAGMTALSAAAAAAITSGALGALAIVEGAKYNGSTRNMIQTEGWNALAIGAMGAGSAVSTITTTAGLDLANITNPTGQDYLNGVFAGFVLGSAAQGANRAFGSTIGHPVGVVTRGGWRFYSSYIPQEDKK